MTSRTPAEFRRWQEQQARIAGLQRRSFVSRPHNYRTRPVKPQANFWHELATVSALLVMSLSLLFI